MIEGILETLILFLNDFIYIIKNSCREYLKPQIFACLFCTLKAQKKI